ncbi:hypothetical protein N7491_009679 [Penicillium cf. griseofulvum]|uniref:Apple domain-containing protein n=1 Tax=Penicillium cf. griseofulvum TaxID=2972120 RepID=A0A9W9T541_9EURO|nr:hypothetical protein N7472_000008 [Penicillium cf. griseofulvum]KAJ5421234.1 hypothetical protein N7491_009679 [Penicillium cf. griseofulvum]KAJ5424469.1 hypothetical protein N7445_010442 [Penicillium cf. griseofulvum]
MFRTILAIVVLWNCVPQARGSGQCFSDSNLSADDYYKACCPENRPVRIESVGDTGFLYYCDRPTGDLRSVSNAYAANPRECANSCTTKIDCKMSIWVKADTKCYIYTGTPFSAKDDTNLVSSKPQVIMIKTDKSVNPTPPVDCQREIEQAVQDCKKNQDIWEGKFNTCDEERVKCQGRYDACKDERRDCNRDYDKCKDDRDKCNEERSNCEEQQKKCPPIPPENEALDTQKLCPEHNGTEFYLPTPDGERTKWRVYCHYEYSRVNSDAGGYMNGTDTPYRVLLANRHWDRGFRILHWLDDHYTLGTLFNMPPHEAKEREGRIVIYRRDSSNTNHIIARIDDEIPLRIEG